MSFESTSGLNVSNHYGSRETGGSAGVVGTQGRTVEAVIDINEDVISNGGPELVDFVIPSGAVITEAYVRISAAFTLGGTTPAIEVGTDGSEETNGVTISEAQAEATGSYDLTGALAGTWAAPLAADTTVGVALSGTTPTSTGEGKGKVYIKYVITE